MQEKWQPNTCLIRDVSHASALKCFKDKSVMFVGDSLNRCVFWGLLGWLTQSKTPFRLYAPPEPGQPSLTISEKNLDHFQGYDQRYFEIFPTANATVTYVTGWNSVFEHNFPHRIPGGYFTGERVRTNLKASYFAAQSLVTDGFKRARDSGQSSPQADADEKFLLSRVAHPDVLVLSLASHDMLADDIHAYKRNLRTAVQTFRLKWGFKGKLIWLGATPPVPDKQGEAFEHYKFLQTLTKTRQYNAAASEVMRENGAEVLDPYQMALSRPEQSYDGQHYVGSGNGVLDDVVYMNIRAALLHSICAPSSSSQGSGGWWQFAS
jgi:hypothetical protein